MRSLRIVPFMVVLLCAAACAPGRGQVQLAQQERRSCAELGIDTGSPAFDSCVGNLDATMFEQRDVAAR